MGRWYWLEWRTIDHVALWARVWQQWGLACSIAVLVFLVIGGGCLIIALPDGGNDVHDRTVAAVVAGPAIGLAALLYAGACAACLGSSVADRLKKLNNRIDELDALLRHDRDMAGRSGS